MSRFITDTFNQTIKIDGKVYTRNNLNLLSYNNDTGKEIYNDIYSFLKEWWDGKDIITVHTSGSTGAPKAMIAEKKKMIASAITTLSFLDINKHHTALLCMPLNYIAGKMMLVRALVGGFNLLTVNPCGNPLNEMTISPHFAAMIPLQVYNSVQDEKERKILQGIHHLIIGGGAIDEKLQSHIEEFPNNIWSTYGMTETLSHVAMRRINGKDKSEWYTPLKDVKVTLTTDNRLIINAPRVCDKELITNDIAEINYKGNFKINGRKDNVINSGGIKIQIEQVEALISNITDCNFMITWKADEKFGQKIVMLIEGKEDIIDNISEKCRKNLPKHWQPKEYIAIYSLPLTETGKPDRATAIKIASDI